MIEIALPEKLTCEPETLFKDPSIEAPERWMTWLKSARDLVASRKNEKSILIELGAQHPLQDGVRPAPEFQARLDKGVELYKTYTAQGYHVEIYVPGSRHMEKGVEDLVSLCDAGVIYLAQHGVPAKALHGEDLNDAYKGHYSDAPLKGVYSSADESYVACRYYQEKGFGRMVTICSPIHMQRQRLHSLANGVLPEMVTIFVESFYHKAETEMTVDLPLVLNAKDPTLQAIDSPRGLEFRKLRMPHFDGHQPH
jgi:hypothetical protein